MERAFFASIPSANHPKYTTEANKNARKIVIRKSKEALAQHMDRKTIRVLMARAFIDILLASRD